MASDLVSTFQQGAIIMSQENVSFKVTKAECDLISKIVARGAQMALAAGIKRFDTMSANMDITACHANGCKLRLEDMLAADDFNFSHDFFGISRHIDRDTGKMLNCFLPRFNAPNNKREKIAFDKSVAYTSRGKRAKAQGATA